MEILKEKLKEVDESKSTLTYENQSEIRGKSIKLSDEGGMK